MNTNYMRVGNEKQLGQKTAVVYIRTVSSESSLEHSEAQLKSIKEFAETNNIKIKFVYKDLCVSSFNSYYQKGLDELLDKVENSKIDYVLVTDHSRISRNPSTYISVENRLLRTGAQILPISKAKGSLQ